MRLEVFQVMRTTPCEALYKEANIPTLEERFQLATMKDIDNCLRKEGQDPRRKCMDEEPYWIAKHKDMFNKWK